MHLFRVGVVRRRRLLFALLGSCWDRAIPTPRAPVVTNPKHLPNEGTTGALGNSSVSLRAFFEEIIGERLPVTATDVQPILVGQV